MEDDVSNTTKKQIENKNDYSLSLVYKNKALLTLLNNKIRSDD